MTLRDLIDEAARGEEGPPLTPRQVADVTGERLATVRRWIYIDHVLATVEYGPYRRKAVLRSVILELFCPQQRSARGPAKRHSSDRV